jgi:phosphatidylinositol alpha-mannosyltransferase
MPLRSRYAINVRQRTQGRDRRRHRLSDGDDGTRFRRRAPPRHQSMRICLVTSYDLSRHGGVNKHVLCLASALRRLGDDVEVIGPASGALPAFAQITGFDGVVSIDGNGSENRLGLLTSPLKVWAHLRGRRFDVIHVHEPLNPMLPYYALWSSDAPARIATFHCYTESEARPSRWARRLLAPHLRAFDRGIAVSAPAARYARVAWPRPLAIVANGVDAEFFHPAQARRPLRSGPHRVLFVGQWTDARKGFPHLLAAHRLLRARGLEVVLDVVGQSEAGAPGPAPDDGVRFHGRLTEAELRARFHQCDLFVAPSLGRESFGMVLLEAMAAGCPVVCSDIEGYRQVASPPGTSFVRAGDVTGLAEVVAALCADPARRRAMGQHNIAAAQPFDWTLVARRVRREYESALGLHAGGAQALRHGATPELLSRPAARSAR